MMRTGRPVVVQVVQELTPGGIQVLVLELARLLRADVDTHIVSLESTREHLVAVWPRLRDIAGRLHALAKPPGAHPQTVLRLARLLRCLDAAAVHTHHIGPLLYGGLAARIMRVRRLVHTEHDAWHLGSPRRRRLQAAALKVLRPRLIADAGLVASALVAAIPGSRPQVIRNGIDTAQFRPGNKAAARRRWALPETGSVIGSAGRLEPVKRHWLLIDAVARLPNVTLAIAGDGSQRDQLQARACQLGVINRCHFLGQIDEMEAFYRALDVFCLPSDAEGLPLALLEAQACGVPVVATAVGAVSEVLAPGISLGIDPEPPESLPETLAAALLATLGRPTAGSARQFVVDGFDAAAMAGAYRALLAG